MTPENLESAGEVVEGAAPAVPTPSVPSAGQPPSGGTADAGALAERLERIENLVKEQGKQIPTLVDRAFQSGKDKRFASVERIANALKEAGGDASKATRELEIQDMLDERRQAASPRPDTAVSGTAERARMEKETAEILSEAGIAFDDPDYLALVAQHAGSTAGAEDWRMKVSKFSLRKLKGTAVGAGAALPSAGHSARTEEDDPTKQYNAEIALVKAGKHSTIRPGDVRGIWALQQDYQKRGAKVGSDTPTPTPAQRIAKK
jgi:hypothetical protein